MTDVQPPSPRADVAAPDAGPSFEATELARITGGDLLATSNRPILGAAVDSRLVTPDCLFFALPGERTDGHNYLDAAVAKGAAALIVTRPPADTAALGDVTVVRVRDGVAALQALAREWRARFEPFVVGVTGSIAKTSTKEAVATVLGSRFTTLKNEGNLNNEIGLPITVLALRPEHEAAVLEMGMYVGGEIRDLAAIARPRVGIVTAVQPVHLSRIGSIDAVEQAKGELVEALPPDGTAILNADDERVRRMASRTAARTLTYGFATDADVTARDVRSLGHDGMAFTLRHASREMAMTIPSLGRLAVHNALAAAAAGIVAGLDLEPMAAALATGWRAPHRGELHRAGGVTLVDDSYNASPAAVRAALELLAGLPGRRIAVLGTMLELGDGHVAGHRQVGEAAAATVDLLVVVGDEAGAMAEGARDAGLTADRVLEVPDRAAALETLRPRLREGDVVLVKASRGIALDLLVDDLRRELAGGSVVAPASSAPAGSPSASRAG